MNLKLETEKEKVLPFYAETLTANQEDIGEANDRSSENDIQSKLNSFHSTVLTKDNSPVSQWNILDNFYKRYNKALLDKTALESEKQRLSKENQDLRAILKVCFFHTLRIKSSQQYLNGITVTTEVMNSANPLFIVNGKMPEPIKVTATKVPISANKKAAAPQVIVIQQS